jgi:hypothetical protein
MAVWIANAYISFQLKSAERWVRGAPNVSACTIYHRITVSAMPFKEMNDEKRPYLKK